jgi:hypothetical protein
MKRSIPLILSLAVLSTPAFAQNTGQTTAKTATTPSAAASTEELVRKVKIVTRPRQAIDVPENEPVALDMGLVDVPGASPDLLEGVTAKAYTRYVKVDGNNVGQLVLTAVSKNSKVETLNSAQFVAQFNLKTTSLPDDGLVIEGNQEEMIAALKRLQEEDKKDDKERSESSSDRQTSTTGGGGSSNTDAAGYKSPDGVSSTATEDKSGDTTTATASITTDGCSIRIDLAQMEAIQQSRVEITSGEGTTTSECEDGNDRYAIQRSSATCTDIVNLEGRTAQAAYLLYYVDADGSRAEVQGCQADPEQVFPIEEKTGGCPVHLDYAAMTATPQTVLSYQNANNATVEVRSCQPSETLDSADIAETKDGCSIRHDFTGKKSIQMAKYIYTMDGITYQAGECHDNGTEYPHATVYETSAGQRVCEPIVNQDTGTVTQASRIQITVDGLSTFITECTPDTAATDLVATTEGCTNPATWTHDLTAGVSYGQERYYYTRKSGQREYVTTCQDSQAVYPHQLEITGWQNHDAKLYAYRLSTVHIDTPTGRYDVLKDSVVTGTEQMPYTFLRIASVASDRVTYEGCSQYTEAYQVEYYQRPDTSEYARTIGIGEPQGPVNICSETLVESQQIKSGAFTAFNTCAKDTGGPERCYWYYGYTYGTLDKYQQTNSVTNEIVSTRCAWNGSATQNRPNLGTLIKDSAQAWGASNGCAGLDMVCQTATANPCPF